MLIQPFKWRVNSKQYNPLRITSGAQLRSIRKRGAQCEGEGCCTQTT